MSIYLLGDLMVKGRYDRSILSQNPRAHIHLSKASIKKIEEINRKRWTEYTNPKEEPLRVYKDGFPNRPFDPPRPKRGRRSEDGKRKQRVLKSRILKLGDLLSIDTIKNVAICDGSLAIHSYGFCSDCIKCHGKEPFIYVGIDSTSESRVTGEIEIRHRLMFGSDFISCDGNFLDRMKLIRRASKAKG